MSYCLSSINLNDSIPGTKNFRWNEFLSLRSWEIHCFPKDDITRANIIRTCEVLQKIRDLFNRPVTITSGYRPRLYNEFIGGAAFSSHRTGRAVDFVVHGIDCDEVRKKLVPMLVSLDIRMENKPGSNWVHIDLDVRPDGNRYFKP